MQDRVYYDSHSATNKNYPGKASYPGMKSYHSAEAQHQKKVYGTSRPKDCGCGKRKNKS
ncbi:hypothetical protein DFP93_10183 [Aneurinibacillus soli]|uniref:Uncharacterized protein n=1 Tax=Aneurinibacillus soli TaxID=1500254 RepID=A0A0U4WH75_9BACL|nr:hypothetical protein [Aneurinibacillus soli]PYE64059.1 hypothetical protein DFP93_10183 [Aneurinibacillus soli]BAU28008.1 hypothetical protein CB4_02182 [Aneurinibacillus soli]